MTSNSNGRRVAVTGMGFITPIGSDIETVWSNLIEGVSGVGRITRFDTTNFDTKIAAEVKGFNPEEYMDRKTARHTQAGGPNYAIVSACASSAHGIGEASEIIKRGDAIAMLAGGSEATITPLTMGAFCQIKATSERNDEPEKACRPFDIGRDGFVMGEGSVMFVLEDMDHAKQRGARILAEIAGYGASADMYHFTAPQPEGKGAARAMRQALQKSGVDPSEVGYVNAHGTSTKLGDIAETRAIKSVFGDHAYKLAVSSTKSVHGHLLGAAGAIEAAACVLALDRGLLPPTINLDDPDPDCDLDYVPNRARKADVKVAISNSFGFGGHNATLVIKKAAAGSSN